MMCACMDVSFLACILQASSEKQQQLRPRQQPQPQSLPQPAVTAETLAAKLQKATLEQFLSDEHPPIRRVKMVGVRVATAKVA